VADGLATDNVDITVISVMCLIISVVL